MQLLTPIEQIKRIGPVYLRRLKKLGVQTVKDLLFYFPYRYDDFSKIVPIKDIKPNETVTIRGKILEIKTTRTWKRRMWLTEAIVEDQTAAIKVVWFNQPYISKVLKKEDVVNLAGKVIFSDNSLVLSNPTFEKIQNPKSQILNKFKIQNSKFKIQDTIHTGRLVPVYPETEGISSRWLRYVIKLFLPLKKQLNDPLPPELRRRQNFPETKIALQNIHFPKTKRAADLARRRFSFEELFLIHLRVLQEKLKLSREKAPPIPMNLEVVKNFVGMLPYQLTDAQRKCAWQILKDLEKPRPMNRLLEGDVGSGKTVVATIAILNTVKAGWQVAYMAPTEILAQQHFKEIPRLLQKFKVSIALLTGKQDRINSKKLPGEFIEISRQKLLQKAAAGEIDLVIGTHALIQDKVRFGKLGLVIVDEQHRFGVQQRARLVARGPARTLTQTNADTDANLRESALLPHFLSMTATPIPRTLALTIYGDLDISLVDQLPKGRKKIITEIVTPANRQKTYDFVKKEINNEHRAFVICPLIEESEKLQVKAATKEYEKLSKEIFPSFKLGLLHGKIKTKEKEKIMRDFKKGKIEILVATSVVEVGIDVPNATVMIIEGADRFGLAQLHQFRGRIGRGEKQSYCFLFTDSTSIGARRRLAALINSKDGFELAEKDLEIRGPGDLMGKKQWGIPDLAMASLADLKLVEESKKEAVTLLEKDPGLNQYPLLREKLKTFHQNMHLE